MQPISNIDLEGLGLVRQQPDQSAKEDLGQEDFLRLMVTQFQNQDPFKPMENGEFLGQIAQFGTVSGIQDLQAAFSSLSESLYSDQALQASSLVGRTVLAKTDTGVLKADATLEGAVEVTASTPALTVEITDASGQVVRRMELGPQESGLVPFHWDGVTDEGTVASPGQYKIQARVAQDGGVFAAETLVAATVESVNLARAGSALTLNVAGMGQMALSQVRQIM